MQLLHLNDSSHSGDRLTQRTDTSCDETSRESTPVDPPIGSVTMETAQVETYSRSPDIYPRNSTPKLDVHMHHNGLRHSGDHNSTTQITPLGSIPEKTKDHHYHQFTLSERPELRSKSSPMLRGTRFCSEVSNASDIQHWYICSFLCRVLSSDN